MQTYLKILIIPFLVLFLAAGSAMGYTIDDNYIGEEDYGRGDVIGEVDDFEIDRAELSLSGTTLTVDIYTNFAGKAGSLFSGYTTDGNGIGYGDLFLTKNWIQTTGVANEWDNNIWDFVLILDDRLSNTGGDVSLFSVTDVTSIEYSEDFMTGSAIWRDGQEVAYNPPNGQNSLATGTWSVNADADYISFVMDINSTTLLSGNNIGIHWGMTCANDVIEGAAPVPEPATMLLLGTGLLGLASLGRRKLFKK